jgi:hypothetical protein
MEKQKGPKGKNPRTTRKWLLGPIYLAVIAVLYVLGSGHLAFTIARVQCGQEPVAATKSKTLTYKVPGDTGYGPSPADEYYCTIEDAEREGFRPSTLSKVAKEEAEERRIRTEEAKRFDIAKLNYTAYAPSLGNFEYTNIRIDHITGDKNQTLYVLRNDGARVASVRQGKVGDRRELCPSTSDDRCDVAGTDGKGREVKIKYSESRFSKSYSAKVRIGDTFINFERVDETRASVEELIEIIDSLRPIEGVANE